MERWRRWAVGCCGQDSTYGVDIFSAPSLKQYESQSRIFDQGRDTDHGASLVLWIFLAQSTGIASLKKPTTHNIDFESVIMFTSHQQKEKPWALDLTHHPSSASSRPKSNKCIFVPGGQFKAGTPALESDARAPLLESSSVIFEIKQFQTCPLAEESICKSWDGTLEMSNPRLCFQGRVTILATDTVVGRLEGLGKSNWPQYILVFWTVAIVFCLRVLFPECIHQVTESITSQTTFRGIPPR